MNYVLLLGACFSRNWGGWLTLEVFDYLLGCKEINQDDDLKERLWIDHNENKSFENTLSTF